MDIPQLHMFDDPVDNQRPPPNRPVPLAQGLNIGDLMDGTMFEIDFGMVPDEDMKIKPQFIQKVASCPIDLDDDDGGDGSPFERLGKKMTNITPDGKVKKLVKKEGKGSTPPEDSFVSIRYISYSEYNDEPTDSVFSNDPLRFQLGCSHLVGLDIAVSTMKLNEKSLFLIGYEYAFGKLGHPPRIPPEANLVYEIELVNFSDSAANLGDITRLEVVAMPFVDAKKIIVALTEKGKRHFKRDVKSAIFHYNKGISILDICETNCIDEEEERQKLLLKFYTNLAVCYVKDEKPRRVLEVCKHVCDMTKDGILSVPAKVYYQEGLALNQLLNFNAAFAAFRKAQKIAPNNEEINARLKQVKEHIDQAKVNEVKWKY